MDDIDALFTMAELQEFITSSESSSGGAVHVRIRSIVGSKTLTFNMTNTIGHVKARVEAGGIRRSEQRLILDPGISRVSGRERDLEDDEILGDLSSNNVGGMSEVCLYLHAKTERALMTLLCAVGDREYDDTTVGGSGELREHLSDVTECDTCGKESVDSMEAVLDPVRPNVILRYCGGCHGRAYCSKQCLVDDYLGGHKQGCAEGLNLFNERIALEKILQKLHDKTAENMLPSVLAGLLHQELEYPFNYAIVANLLKLHRGNGDDIVRILTTYFFDPRVSVTDYRRANKSGCVQHVLAAMRSNVFEDDSEETVCLVCLEVIRVLSFYDRSSEHKMDNPLSIRDILNTMEMHDWSSLVQHTSLEILARTISGGGRHHSSNSNAVFINVLGSEMTAVSIVGRVLIRHSRNLAGFRSDYLAHRALVTMRHLIDRGRDEQAVSYTVDARVTGATLSLLNKRQSSSLVQQHGLGLLREIGKTSQNLMKEITEGCLRAARRAMNAHSTHLSVIIEGLYLIQMSDCDSGEGLIMVSHPDNLDVVLESMAQFHSDETVIRLALPILDMALWGPNLEQRDRVAFTVGGAIFSFDTEVYMANYQRVTRNFKDLVPLIRKAKDFTIDESTSLNGLLPTDRGNWIALCDTLLERLPNRLL